MHKVVSILVLAYFCSCKQDAETINRQLILPDDSSVHVNDTIVLDSITHTYFSRIQKPDGAGLTYSFSIPRPYQEKELYVIFKGLARSNFAVSKGVLVFVAFDESWKQLCWWALPIRPHLKFQSAWNPFIDSLHVPSLIENRKYTYVKAHPFLGESPGEKLDIDSFEVIIKKRGDY